MANLYPIFAEPNPPFSFDGLDVSLSAGQMTGVVTADYNGTPSPFNVLLNGNTLEFGVNDTPLTTLTPFNVTTTNGTGGTATWDAIIAGSNVGEKITALVVPPSPNILAVVDTITVSDTEVDPLNQARIISTGASFIDTTTSGGAFINLADISVVSDSVGLIGSVMNLNSFQSGEGTEAEGSLWNVTMSRSGFALNDAPTAGGIPATALLNTTSLYLTSGTDGADTISLSTNGLNINNTTGETGVSLTANGITATSVSTAINISPSGGVNITDNTDPVNPLTTNISPTGFTFSSGEEGALSMSLSTASLNVAGADGVGFIHSQVGVSGTNNVLTYSLAGDGLSFSDTTNPEVSAVTLNSVSGLTISQDINSVYLTPNGLTMENTASSGTYLPNGVTTGSEYTFTIGGDGDTLVLPSDGLIYKGITGGLSGDTLKVTINGTPYLIALLSAP